MKKTDFSFNSGFGKLILCGEYYILHPPAHGITFAINKCLTVSTVKNNTPDLVFIKSGLFGIKEKSFKITDNPENLPDFIRVFAYAIQLLGINFGINITINSNIESYIGFGSSSALAVALVKCLTKMQYPVDYNIDIKYIFNICLILIRKTENQKASGLDIAASLSGGLISYKRLNSVDYEINHLPFNWLLENNAKIIAVYSGKKTKTKDAINMVHLKTPILDAMQECTNKVLIGIEKSDFRGVCNSLNEYHKLMCKIGVSTPQIDNINNIAMQNGAYCCKISGSGMGDCCIIICDTIIVSKLLNVYTTNGFTTFNIDIPKHLCDTI